LPAKNGGNTQCVTDTPPLAPPVSDAAVTSLAAARFFAGKRAPTTGGIHPSSEIRLSHSRGHLGAQAMHAPTVRARLPAKNGRSTLFVTDTPTLAPPVSDAADASLAAARFFAGKRAPTAGGIHPSSEIRLSHSRGHLGAQAMHATPVGARLPAKTGGSTPFITDTPPLAPPVSDTAETPLAAARFSRASALLHPAAFAQRLRFKSWSAIPAKRSTRPARNLRV